MITISFNKKKYIVHNICKQHKTKTIKIINKRKGKEKKRKEKIPQHLLACAVVTQLRAGTTGTLNAKHLAPKDQ